MRYLFVSIVFFVVVVLFATLSSAAPPVTPTFGGSTANAGANAVAGAAAGAHAVAGGANVKNSIDFGINTSNSNEINNLVGVGVEIDNKHTTMNNNANSNRSVNTNTATGNSNYNSNYSSPGNLTSNQWQNQHANNEGVSNTTIVHGDEAPNLSRSPGTPATVFVDACSSGASASVPGMGATFGQGNPVCLWLSLSSAAYQQGDLVLAGKFLEEAEKSLRMQTAVTRWINWVPLVGRLF